MNNLYIGAHFSISKGIVNAIKSAIQINANAMQIFLKSPQSTKTKVNISDDEASEIKNKLQENNIKLYVHASYLLNFCKNPPPSRKNIYAIKLLLEDLKFADKIGAVGCVIHMGTQNEKGKLTYEYDQAVDNFVENINHIIKEREGNAKIIFETPAGQGKQITKKIEQFADLYHKFNKKQQKEIMFCIDTCHIFVDGYNIMYVDGMMKYLYDFHKLIGLDKITLIHLNDSKAKLGSRKDRHQHLKEGYIFKNSFESLEISKSLCIELSIPMVLETHDNPPYKLYEKEVKIVRNLSIHENIYENITRKLIIDILSKLEKTSKFLGESFRSKAYGNAIRIIRNYDKSLPRTAKELLKIKGIGKGISEKIEEIIKTKKCQKLIDMENNPKIKATNNLSTLVGIGPKIAQQLVKKNITDLDKLRKAVEKGEVKLTNAQKLGLKYYDDLNSRIPRKEIENLDKYIRKIAKKIKKTVKLEIMGSYRRKKETSGDIDIMMSDSKIKNKEDVDDDYIELTVEMLKKEYEYCGTLSHGKFKFAGLFRLEEKVRHIDIIFIPMKSYYTSMLYFTGSKEHNIKMREAAKARGLKLNEFGLFDGDKMIEIKSEKDVFEILEIEYISPKLR